MANGDKKNRDEYFALPLSALPAEHSPEQELPEGEQLDTSHPLVRANKLAQTGDNEAALVVLWGFACTQPTNASVWNQLGTVYRGMGEPNAALTCFRLCQQFSGIHGKGAMTRWQALCNEAEVLGTAGKKQESIDLSSLALAGLDNAEKSGVRVDLERSIVKGNMAAHLIATGEIEQAEIMANEATIDYPKNIGGWMNLVAVCQRLNDPRRGYAAACKAVEISPTFAEAHWNKGVMAGLNGNWRECFAEMEWRSQWPQHRARHPEPAGRKWEGQMLSSGDSLCVVAEQGFGDWFMFTRFLRCIRREPGSKVLAIVPENLKAISNHIPGIDAVYGFHDADNPCKPPDVSKRADYTYWVAAGSIPFHVGVDENFVRSLPIEDNFIGLPVLPDVHPVREAVSKARREGNLCVGIFWKGSPYCAHDISRSLDVEHLAQLKDVPGIQWFSIQFGPQADHGGVDKLNIGQVNCHDLIDSWADTASIISEMDGMLTVDSAIGHVAGLLHVPTMNIIPAQSEWRWADGSIPEYELSTPWYPSMVLCRRRWEETPADSVGRAAKMLQWVLTMGDTVE